MRRNPLRFKTVDGGPEFWTHGPGEHPNSRIHYRSYSFTSRAEAQWAAFFSHIGWRWRYRPGSYDGWEPTFLITGARPLLVDVTAARTLDELRVLLAPGHHRLKGPEVLLVGVSPLLRGGDDHAVNGASIFAGLLGEVCGGWLGEPEVAEPAEAIFDAAGWHRCPICRATAVHHTIHSYTARPCGHYDGDHLPEWEPNEDWRHACQSVRWLQRHRTVMTMAERRKARLSSGGPPAGA